MSVLKAIVEMPPAIVFAMFSIEVTFLLGETKTSCPLLYCETGWIANVVASASSTFKVFAPVAFGTSMVAQDGAIDLAAPDPC